MIIVHVKNLTKENGICDYKTLNLDNVVPGSQVYPTGINEAYLKYNGELIPHADLEVITEDTYLKVKEEQNKQPSQQELLNAKLLKDNATMQIELENQKKFNADLMLKLASLGGK